MKSTKVFRGGITRYWWVPLITGLVCIGFGIWCLFSPVTALPTFAYIFSACIVAAGVLNIVYACTAPRELNWGWALAIGILEGLAGVWLLTMPPEVLTISFIYVVGIWVLCSAVVSIAESAMLAAISPAWIVWMALLLIATIVLVIVFLANPIAGGIAVWLYMGLALITFGCYRVSLAMQVHSINRRVRGY